METMAAKEELLCAMMMMLPLMMPFVWGILFGMCLVNLQETQVVCYYAHPCFKGHTVLAIIMETMVVMEDMLCLTTTTMMTMPLMMPFIWGTLFGMCLVNLQETQVVCY
jgi:hypothetical protein